MLQTLKRTPLAHSNIITCARPKLGTIPSRLNLPSSVWHPSLQCVYSMQNYVWLSTFFISPRRWIFWRAFEYHNNVSLGCKNVERLAMYAWLQASTLQIELEHGYATVLNYFHFFNVLSCSELCWYNLLDLGIKLFNSTFKIEYLI